MHRRGAATRPALLDALWHEVASRLARTSASYWAVPGVEPGMPRIGVRADERREVGAALASLQKPGHRIARHRELPATVPLTAPTVVGLVEDSAMLRVVADAPFPQTTLGHSEIYVDVEFWVPDGDELVAPRPSASGTRIRATDRPSADLRVAGGVSVYPTFPSLAERRLTDVSFPVDVVYTWVDAADPAWQAARSRAVIDALSTTDASIARFRSRDELRYSLRSLEEFAPWVRYVHIVTAGHLPPWLETSDRVRAVRHDEILDAAHLPTFNSHAIESALHRVPGLSEHFLYFNDDVLLFSPAWPEHYFEGNGTCRFFPSRFFYPPTSLDVPGYKSAALRGQEFFRKNFGVAPRTFLRHTPHALRVSTLQAFEDEYPQVFETTRRARFRGGNDFNTIAMAQFYAYFDRRAAPASTNAELVFADRTDALERLRRLYRDRVRSVCLNDEDGPQDERHWSRIHAYLDEVFPARAAAEDESCPVRVPPARGA